MRPSIFIIHQSEGRAGMCDAARLAYMKYVESEYVIEAREESVLSL